MLCAVTPMCENNLDLCICLDGRKRKKKKKREIDRYANSDIENM